VPPEIE
jgi:translation initiation factor IF-1